MIYQPGIRGIQTVGHAELTYRYLRSQSVGEGEEKKDHYYLPIPPTFTFGSIGSTTAAATDGASDTSNAVDLGTNGALIAGFRLDGEFLRANPQIASSFVIPILGGGGVALTNNNRTGTITFNCAKVSVPKLSKAGDQGLVRIKPSSTGASVGVDDDKTPFFDLVTLAQLQQAQVGGDAYGADLILGFEFSNILCTVTFQACTVATVDPLALSGNDAASYQVVFNYLGWKSEMQDAGANDKNFELY